MTAHQYLQSVLKSQTLEEWEINPLREKRQEIETDMRSCFGSFIKNFYYSGSIAKRTAIRLSYDLDLCIYFRRDSFPSLYDMYYQVYEALDERYRVKEQKVSIALENHDIDVVPARKIDDDTEYANLYRTDTGTYIQTSIPVHIRTISESGLRNIIKLMKIWKERHDLHFKSFVLELLVIRASSGKSLYGYDNKVLEVLRYIKDNIKTVSLIDPANSNNIVSDLILVKDKEAFRRQARESLSKQYWSDIIWY